MSQSLEDIDLNPKITEPDKEELSATAPDIKKDNCLDPLLDTYYLDVKVYLEGVQVPHAQVSVSYGIGNPPTATILIPANNFLRDIPQTTKVHVTHKDLLPNEQGDYRERLLFDGEVTGHSYTIEPQGAMIVIQAIHCCAYLTLMQLMCQEVREYMLDNTWTALGNSVCYLSSSFNSLQVCLMGAIIDHKKDYISSMADVIYLMLDYIINESAEYSSRGGAMETSAALWYHEKLGKDGNKSFKLVNRIYGTSLKAKNAGKIGDYTKGFEDTLNKYKEPGSNTWNKGNYPRIIDPGYTGAMQTNSGGAHWRQGAPNGRLSLEAASQIKPNGSSNIADSMFSLSGKMPYRLADGSPTCMLAVSCGIPKTDSRYAVLGGGKVANVDQAWALATKHTESMTTIANPSLSDLKNGDIVIYSKANDRSNMQHAAVYNNGLIYGSGYSTGTVSYAPLKYDKRPIVGIIRAK